MVNLLSEEKGAEVFIKYQPALEKEYHFWMNGADELNKDNNAVSHVVLPDDENILNRYWDSQTTPRPEAFIEDAHLAGEAANAPETVYRHVRAAAASGWDFSSRWFNDGNNMHTIQTADLIPVDLNCLVLYLEETLLKIYRLQHNETAADLFKTKIEKRRNAIQKFCWNEEQGCYFDFNFIENKPIIHFNLATVFPLFFNVATKEQAAKIETVIKEKFICPGGVVTTIYKTGQQWDAPNGWAPLQWMAYKGLMNYGFTGTAGTIKNNWLANCEKVYNETGKMMEKYNVMDTSISAGGGEYPNQDGFGWTNGVYLKMRSE